MKLLEQLFEVIISWEYVEFIRRILMLQPGFVIDAAKGHNIYSDSVSLCAY